MISARTFRPAGRPVVRFAAAAALLTAITGVATFPASASPASAAGHGGLTASAVTIRPLSAAALAGTAPLTEGSGRGPDSGIRAPSGLAHAAPKP